MPRDCARRAGFSSSRPKDRFSAAAGRTGIAVSPGAARVAVSAADALGRLYIYKNVMVDGD